MTMHIFQKLRPTFAVRFVLCGLSKHNVFLCPRSLSLILNRILLLFLAKNKEIRSHHLNICQKDNHSVELVIAQSMASQTLVYDLKK